MDGLFAPEIFEFITAQQLIDHSFVDELPAIAKRFPVDSEFTNELVRLGKLTQYQQELLLSGQGEKLIFGPYRLVELLAEGGMGKVFKARHPRLDRLVALKFVHPQHLESDAHAISRFHREARAIAQLQHPNIVLLYDADEIDGTPFIAMEFVNGVSLDDMVRNNGPLGVNTACEYMRQAALGLQHAFECGLVHRDIKPSNIVSSRKKNGNQASLKGPSLVTIRDRNRKSEEGDSSRTDTIKILDMGLALLKDSLKGDRWSNETALTDAGMTLGTPDCIAPEQARDSRNVDIRADLYSLGCTFYYVLTGQMPFPFGTPVEKLLKHQLDKPTPLGILRPNVPSAIAGIVEKLMAKKPDQRFQTPQELVDVLTKHLAQALPEPEPAMPADTHTPTRATIALQALNPSLLTVRLQSAANPTDLRDSTIEKSADASRAVHAPALSHMAIPLDNLHFDTDCKDEETDGSSIVDLTNDDECEPIAKIGAHVGVVSAVAVAPDGTLAATGDVNGRIRIWDLSESEPREIACVHRPTEIQAIAFAPDESNYIVFGELHKGKAALIRWDWQSQSFLEWGDFSTLDHSGVGCLRFTADGAMLAAGVGPLAVTWKIEHGAATKRKVHQGQATPIRALAMSPDRLLLATAGQHEALRFWDLGKRGWNRNAGFQARSPAASITTMSFSPDGNLLAMAGVDPEIVLWDMAGSDDECVRVLSGHSSSLLHCQFVGDGSQLVSVAVNGQVFLWEVRTATILRQSNLNLNMAYRVAMSDDATRLVVGFSNGTVAFCQFPPVPSYASDPAMSHSH